MATLYRLDSGTLCATQIAPEDIADLKARGVTAIVNNRPDREAAGQPDGAEIADAARDAGIAYHEIAITMSGADDDDVKAMADLIATTRGTLLAYCRSGTRSAMLWAMARARLGGDTERILAQVEEAGFRSGPVRGPVERIAAEVAA